MVQFYSSKPKSKKISQPLVTVTIDSLDVFGQGVAKYNGKTLFVAGALPDEEAEVKIIEDKRQYAKAKVVKRFNDSQWRVAPRCPHFGHCGGCQQQHISSDLQRQSKLNALLHLLERETGVESLTGDILFGESYHYRRRVRLGVNYDMKKKHLTMGFRQIASNDLVEIKCCPVMRKELERLIIPLRECLASLKTANKIGHVELVLADNGVLMVLRHISQLTETDRQKLTQFANQHQLSLYLATNDRQQELLFGQAPYYSIKQLKLFFNPQGFIQVNENINEKMIEKALQWLDINSSDRILDLFCGVGNFTLPIAEKAGNVIGVEGVNSLVELGLYNAEFNGLNNIQFFHENLDTELNQQQWAAQQFNKILLDPARAGAFEVMAQLIKLSPQSIVYVSCNPATLARDCNVLLIAGYKLKEICMIDMFPNTGHLESMILFTK